MADATTDAEKKALLAKDRLAGKEMEVDRYFLKQGSYFTGVNRFKRVVTDYGREPVENQGSWISKAFKSINPF